MPTVLITPEALIEQPGKHIDIFRDAGFEIRFPKDPIMTRGLGTEEETIAEIEGVDATIAGGEIYTPKVLTALSQLRVIARAGVGFDRVDIPTATERGVVVTITPTANHEGVAEQALALLFGVAKKVIDYDRRLRAGEWPRQLLRPVRGETLGVFGMGRVGKSMALKSQALGMTVIASDKYPDEAFAKEHGVEIVPFDDLLARSDYVSIHSPLNDETRGMFNESVFSKMKKGSVLLNTARGDIVAEADLMKALESGHLAAAGLDVFEEEPAKADNPLFALDNVTLSPHVAGLDRLSQDNMAIEAAECIVKLHSGEWPEGAVVNDDLRNGWKW